MVKVVRTPGAGPEIVTLKDLVPSGAPSTLSGGSAGPSPTLLGTVEHTVNSLDKYITLADKGITMLGRIDSLASKFVQRGAPQQPPARQIPVHRETEAPITYVHGAPTEPAVQAPVTPVAPTVPAPQATGIDVGQIVQALELVEKMQPGITVKELRESIAKQPEAIGHIIQAYAGVNR